MARAPIYQDVAEKIRQQIAAGGYPAGLPLPSERELADAFAVSRPTVRKAMDVLDRSRYVERLQGRGTFALVPDDAVGKSTILYAGESRSHFYSGFYAALCAEAGVHGRAITSFTPVADDRALGRFSRMAAEYESLICTEEAWEQIEIYVPHDVRVTRISGFHSTRDHAADERPGFVVSTDEFRATQMAVEHLIQLGHRKIGLLDVGWENPSGDPLLGIADTRRETSCGYTTMLGRHRIQEQWWMTIPDQADVADWQVLGERSIHRHFDIWEERPTAIVSVADFRVAPLLRVLRERGLRVPEDVSVMGIGNTPWATALDPQLTTICLGEVEMARLALLLSGETPPDATRIVRVAPQLVVRESTAERRGEG